MLLARRITAHGGLYRQKQYIGKLMRKFDAEPIRAALDAKRDRERVEAMRFHRIEQWRDRLLQEGAAARRAARVPKSPASMRVPRELCVERAQEQQTGARTHPELFRALREPSARCFAVARSRAPLCQS